MRFCYLLLLVGFAAPLSAQVKIGNNPSAVNNNSVLHLESDPAAGAGGGKGLLLPVLTDMQLPAASNSIQGMIIFNSTQNCLQICDGTAWKKLLVPAVKTKIYSLSAVAFNTTETYNRNVINGGVYIPDGTPGTPGALYAEVNLPDGAQVTGMDVYVKDFDASWDISTVQLWRQDAAVGTAFGNSMMMAQTPATAATSPVIQKISTSLVTNPVIDNSNYTYYMRLGTVQSAPNLILFRVVITYTITAVD